MTDQPSPPAQPQAEMVRGCFITEGLSHAISPEKIATMLFKIREGGPDGSKFAVSLPVQGLKQLRAMVDDMITAAEKLEMNPGFVVLRKPTEIEVGNSNHMRGCIVLTFNKKKSDEMAFLIPDEHALGLAQAMERDIYGRMTEKGRREHVIKQQKLMMPGSPQLILPR